MKLVSQASQRKTEGKDRLKEYVHIVVVIDWVDIQRRRELFINSIRFKTEHMSQG